MVLSLALWRANRNVKKLSLERGHLVTRNLASERTIGPHLFLLLYPAHRLLGGGGEWEREWLTMLYCPTAGPKATGPLSGN